MIQDIRPHQFDNSFVNSSDILEDDYVFCFKGNALLLIHNGNTQEIPRKKDVAKCPSKGTFLFTLNNTHCFLVWDCPGQKKSPFLYHEIKFRNIIHEKEIDWCSGVAFQLKNWYEQNKFCGQCGGSTEQKISERAITCPSCKTSLYPSISPAIIVAILCKDKILLARGVNFPKGYYSLVAGYVDTGESIEGAIIREVKEEVGIDIKNIRYYNSQPWPFSGSMMIGFIAEADEEQAIIVDKNEIAEAAWFSRSSLPNYPPDRSIAGEIIDKFKTKKL